MRLYFIRHGQSIGNKEGFIQGKLDLGLSDLGFEQSKMLAERISQMNIDVIYSSPLLRAQQTTGLIASYHPDAELITSELLTGRTYGEFQKNSFYSILGQNSKSLSLLYKIIDGSNGVESRSDVGLRAKACMDEIIEKYPGQNVVIVTHNEIKASCIQHLFHPDMPNDYHNASLTILEYEDGIWDFGTLNDITHLYREKSME